MPTCTVEHYRAPERARHTVDGYTICTECTDGLGRDLYDLPRLHDELIHLHNARHGDDQTKISGSRTPRLPINPAVTDLRADMRATATDWCVYAAQQAQAVNASTAQRWLSLDVGHGAGWLRFNRDWCARQEWAPDLVTAIRHVSSQARRMLDPRPRYSFTRPGDQGQCVRETDQTPCGGHLWFRLPTSRQEALAIECDRCLHRYPPTSWNGLGEQVRARKVAA
jgi:hypothetical protein